MLFDKIIKSCNLEEDVTCTHKMSKASECLLAIPIPRPAVKAQQYNTCPITVSVLCRYYQWSYK